MWYHSRFQPNVFRYIQRHHGSLHGRTFHLCIKKICVTSDIQRSRIFQYGQNTIKNTHSPSLLWMNDFTAEVFKFLSVRKIYPSRDPFREFFRHFWAWRLAFRCIQRIVDDFFKVWRSLTWLMALLIETTMQLNYLLKLDATVHLLKLFWIECRNWISETEPSSWA